MSLKTIKGQREKKKSFEKQVAELREENEQLRIHAAGMEERLARFHATLKELVDSANASNVLLSSVERFLDETHGEDWDGGVRREIEARAELLKARKELIARSQNAKEMENDERTAFAREFWKVSGDIGMRAQDCGMVVALLPQSKEVNLALDVVEEIRRDQIQLPPDIEKLIQTLVARCAEIAKSQQNEVAEQRVARVPSLVDPSGRPISSD
jgi:hypothetical protein